jgi:hypothetical protein
MNKNTFELEELKNYLCFGVAGNFANHLGEAGEADEFSVIDTKEKDAPKGLFPFYIPNHESFLGKFPLCNDKINHNNMEYLQVEAEVGLICDYQFDSGRLTDIIPRYFTAFNDCSNRIQDGSKLSTKKNWGQASKGISPEFIQIDDFVETGVLNKFHIASFVRRDGVLKDYGTVSAVKSYSYFFEQLKYWMIDKFNTQDDCGPLEELNPFIRDIQKSRGLFIAAGATAYTEFGKSNYLQKGDEIFVYVYNAHFHSFNDIVNDMCGDDILLSQCSKLHQIVQ